MKKILSLILILTTVISMLLLPSCRKDDEVTPPAGNVVPSTPEELLAASFAKTQAAFFSAATESFDLSGGVKTNISLDAPALSGIKLDADIIASAPNADRFLGVNVKNFSTNDFALNGIKVYLTDTELVAGFDSLISRNLGLKFTEAEDQIVALVSKIMPGTSVGSIRSEVKRYLSEFENIFSSSSSEKPQMTDAIAAEIIKVLRENVTMTMATTDSAYSLTIEFTLRDILYMIEDCVLVLKDDDAWRAYFNDLDNALRSTVFVDTAIPTNVTVLDYYINEFESLLADEGITPDMIEFNFNAQIDKATLLVTSAEIIFSVDGKSAMSVAFTANYESQASFTAVVKVHKNDLLGTEADENLLEIKYLTTQNGTKSGFILDVTSLNSDAEGIANSYLYIERIVINYSKDSANNAYSLSVTGYQPMNGESLSILYAEGVAYESKDEFFLSVDEVGSDLLGATVTVNFKIKMTKPTENDLKLPAYDDVGSISSAELSKIQSFISSILPEEGVALPDTSN